MDSIFVNGTVGVGKSTLADALSAAERGRHAVIDLDAIRRLVPAPETDRFNHEPALLNLQNLTNNYRAAGATRFILAGVIESEAEIPRYVAALGSGRMFVCRLVARPEVLESRLRFRHRDDPEGLAWHLDRVNGLSKILEAAETDDLVLDSSDIPAVELAVAVRRAAGWD